MTSRACIILILTLTILALGACKNGAEPVPAQAQEEKPGTEQALRDPLAGVVTGARPAIVQILPVVGPDDAYFGSGFLVSDDGLVATNRHVAKAVNMAYRVRIWGLGTRIAIVVAVHPFKDIALLKIKDAEGTSFKTLPLMEELPAGGQRVLNVGFSGEVGIASAMGRVLENHVTVVTEMRERYRDMIRSSDDLEGGSSGSPLLNEKGEVVGMHTLGGDRSSHSVPASYVKSAINSFRKTGSIKVAHFGAEAEQRRRGAEEVGWQLTKVPGGSPADEAGLLVGDIIRSLGGRALSEKRCLSLAIAEYLPGSSVEVVFLRYDEEMRVTATLSDAWDK